MIVKVETNKLIQKCAGCNKLHALPYSELSIVTNFIALHPCDQCGSLEVLSNNNRDDEHSIMVTRVFANVATAQG